MYISQQTLEKWLQEDMPYFDLTTHLLQPDNRLMQLDFHVREVAVLSGSEEVKRIADMLGVSVTHFVKSGSEIAPGNPFLSLTGTFEALNQMGKVAQNIFEYASAIATRTAKMTSDAKEGNPYIHILPTRKIFPGTKELAIKSVLTGGAYPHRLGLSESILFFKQHIDYIGGFKKLPVKIDEIKQLDIEKKVIVEVETEAEAQLVSDFAIDGIQYDKFASETLARVVAANREKNPHLIHLAAGGIAAGNVKEYAKTGVDGLVTTAVYFGKPVDIGLKYKEL